MKKLLSILMALIMTFTCMSMGAISANADEFDDFLESAVQLVNNAESIEWDSTAKTGSHSFTINSQAVVLKDYMSVLKFKAPYAGWFEFSIDALPATGVVTFSVESEDDNEELYTKDASAGASILGKEPIENLKTGAKLKAGSVYFVIIAGSETASFSANVVVKPHTHQYAPVETSKAYYEYDEFFEEVFSYDGGKIQPCQNCGYEKTVETYYAPKSLSLSYTSAVYNGKAKTPKVTVKDRKGNVIPASNYSVKYKNNVKPGMATVTVNFTGSKYSGTMTKTFIIKPRKATLSSVSSPSSKKLTVKWSKDANATGYQIAYSTSSKFTKNTTKYVTVKGANTTQKTITGLTGKKKYYVKVREYKTINGKNYYGDYSAVKNVTVKK